MSRMKDLYMDIVEMLDARMNESEIAYKLHCEFDLPMEDAVSMVEAVASSMEEVYGFIA